VEFVVLYQTKWIYKEIRNIPEVENFFWRIFAPWWKKRHVKRLLESRLCMRYKSSSLQTLKFFHFEFVNQMCMFFMFYICEGSVSFDCKSIVFLVCTCLLFVYTLCLLVACALELHMLIMAPLKPPSGFKFQFFFLHPPPHCLLSIWSLSMSKHSVPHPIMILQKLCRRGNTRLLTMLSLKLILQAL